MKKLCSACIFLSLLGCMQSVHLKVTRPLSRVVIDDQVFDSVGLNGLDAQVPVNFGPAKYSVYESEKLVYEGTMPRSQIDPWIFGLSVGGAMLLTPTLAFAGALSVNPSWIFASSVFLGGGGAGSFWAYLAQTASFWTMPMALLGAALGLLPLIGLAYSERLPDVVLIATPEDLRR